MVDEWQRRVKAYSALALTFPKDIFPALGGIARDFQARYDGLGRYQAGMWQNTLLYNLSWCDGVKRVAEWRAPTWSWASIEGPIRFRLDENDESSPGEPLCKLIDVNCTPLSNDPFGPLKDASITLEGYVVTVDILWSEYAEAWNNYEDDVEIYLDYRQLDFVHWTCWPDPNADRSVPAPTYSEVRLFLLGAFGNQYMYLMLKDVGGGVYERCGDAHEFIHTFKRDVWRYGKTERVTIV
jgi:hypothetical protein